MQFLSYLINGLGLGSVYAIIALGYTMVYGIAKMLNFAHGDIIMIGAYIAFFALTKFALPFPLAVLAAIVVCTMLGVLIERLAYKPLRQAPSLAVLITAIGVSYFLQNGAQILWSSSSKVFPSAISTGSISLGSASVSYLTLITIATCIVVMICLTLFINRTKTGSAMRACSEDKGASMLMGINVNMIISITFAIGSGLAAIASVLLASTYPSVYPTMGSMPGIKAFTASHPCCLLPHIRPSIRLWDPCPASRRLQRQYLEESVRFPAPLSEVCSWELSRSLRRLTFRRSFPTP